MRVGGLDVSPVTLSRIIEQTIAPVFASHLRVLTPLTRHTASAHQPSARLGLRHPSRPVEDKIDAASAANRLDFNLRAVTKNRGGVLIRTAPAALFAQAKADLANSSPLPAFESDLLNLLEQELFRADPINRFAAPACKLDYVQASALRAERPLE